MITLNKEVTSEVYALIQSTDFDYSRIVIADHEINDQELTIFLEDKHDFKSDINECVEVKINIDEFAKFIEKNNFNKYDGICHSESGRPFNGLVSIVEPLKWFDRDATQFQITTVLEALVEAIVKQVVEA